jgi:hypothetical protein
MAALLKRLEGSHSVVRSEGIYLDHDLARRVKAIRLVQLTPESGSGGPLAVVFTDFPGLLVRFGRWHVDAYPHCGCDACDEQVDDLTDEFTDRVEALTRGQFVASVTGRLSPKLTYRFAFADGGGSSGVEKLDRGQAARLGAPITLEWLSWGVEPG